MMRFTDTEKGMPFDSTGDATQNPGWERIRSGKDGSPRIAVIGGGAAGCMAAVSAAREGADVTIFERNGEKRLCLKVGITGKGRCNLTNNCGRDGFMSNVVSNPRFLYSAFSAFNPQDVMAWFEDAGVPLKTERGDRVFPVSDRAADIVHALKKAVAGSGCRVEDKYVASVDRGERGFMINGETGPFDRVIVATGGMSYSSTGSDGSGYALAERFGHTVTKTRPGLVPLECSGPLCSDLQGLSLKNVSLRICRDSDGKTVFEDFGELLFTHFGLSGPIVLTASSAVEGIEDGGFTAHIDLKPALDGKQLDARLVREFASGSNRNYSTVLGTLLPAKFIGPFVNLSGIPADTKANSVTKEQRKKTAELLKDIQIGIKGTRPVNEAVVTRGGVCVREIDPRTMESKLVPGLYFAGEIIDVDAYTGGFNLQIAWSTGRLAGISAANERTVKNKKDTYRKAKMGRKIYSIAIDGPSGAGKSTLAKGIAAAFGFSYVDTGAIYRTVGYAVRERGISPDDRDAVSALLGSIDLKVRFENGIQHMLLDGRDLGDSIRENEISTYASKVSAIPEVRAFLLDTQRRIAAENSVVMDGRDIGTVILPEADVKIFLSASARDRAARRYNELIEKGMPESFEKVLADIEERDMRDSQRDIAPLKAADDAVLLDNSGFEPAQSLEAGIRIVKSKLPELAE